MVRRRIRTWRLAVTIAAISATLLQLPMASAGADERTTWEDGVAWVHDFAPGRDLPIDAVDAELGQNMVEEHGTTPTADETLLQRWITRRDGVVGLHEVVVDDHGGGRLIMTAIDESRTEDPVTITADFIVVDGMVETVINIQGVGTFAGESREANYNCGEADSGNCNAAIASGVVTTGVCVAAGANFWNPFGWVAGTACAVSATTTALTTLACQQEPEPCPTPTLTLECPTEDFCNARARYLLPTRNDGHDVQFVWNTYAAPAPQYSLNASDVLIRDWTAGTGEPVGVGILTNYRYHVSDFIWHSDIRCDNAVQVQFNGEMTTPNVRSRPKPIPVSGQYCSDYGMYGEVG